jgi:hypothetical protein
MGKCFHGFHDSTAIMEWMDAILVVVNQFLKLAKMVSTKMTTTTFEMSIFFNMWVRHHGMLQFIVSNDHDAKFTANF